jgi:AcrR family transcriptional regulator
VPRIVDRADQRVLLARAALELFAREGFSRVTMRGAAEAVGVSTGTLYHYFTDKADLFAAVVDTVVETDVLEVGAGLLALPLPLRLGGLLEATQHGIDRLVRDYRVLIDAVAMQPGRFSDSMAEARERYRLAVMGVLQIDAAHADLVLLALSGLILRAICGDTGTDLNALRVALQRQLQETE